MTSCQKEEQPYPEEEVVSELEACKRNGLNFTYCTGRYQVQVRFGVSGNLNIPSDAIVAKSADILSGATTECSSSTQYPIDGSKPCFEAKVGTVISLEARDLPGWRFVGWKRLKSSYCHDAPIVDQDEPRKAYLYMHEDFMGRCNRGMKNFVVVADYVEIF